MNTPHVNTVTITLKEYENLKNKTEALSPTGLKELVDAATFVSKFVEICTHRTSANDVHVDFQHMSTLRKCVKRFNDE